MNPKQKVQLYFQKYQQAFNHPIIKEFFKNEKNKQLLEAVISNPTTENTCLLDVLFKSFYQRARIVKYVSTLIHFYSIEYDKKARKRQSRYQLIMDNPNMPESNYQSAYNHDFQSPYSSLPDQIENQILYRSLKKLSEKQLRILELIYIYNFTNKEVANYFNESAQNISSLHKKALKKLKSTLLSQ
ncbi:sigma-70 family RNA polymerase sigma factor [Peribacillus simplex]|uniref:sigma-70 family RNA polymerase sigma factor n=1 Tax=Peribacillus simplex TaxID=1478 RepID=UPI003CF91AC6